MKYKVIFILLIITIFSVGEAMEICTGHTKIKALGFPTNDKVVVAGDCGCRIYSREGELLHSLSEYYDANVKVQGFNRSIRNCVSGMAFSSDGSKMALLNPKGIVLYDITEDVKEESHFRCTGNELHRIDFRSGSLYAYSIEDLNQNRVHLYNYITKEFEEVPKISALLGEPTVDGTVFVKIYSKQCDFFDSSRSKEYKFSISSNHENSDKDAGCIVSMAFHPNNIIMALLNNNKVEFWDYKNQKLLGVIDVFEKPDEIKVTLPKKLLSFSPNGKQFVVSINNKLLICDTPFNAMHKLVWFLKNYHGVGIPVDVKRVITNRLWESCFTLGKLETAQYKKNTDSLFSYQKTGMICLGLAALVGGIIGTAYMY